LRRAEQLSAFLLEWMQERKGCLADQDVRAALSMAARVESDAAACPRAEGAGDIAAAAHLAGFALASYETTTTTLAWALLLLVCHPNVAAALADEVAAVGPVDAVDDPETLAALPILDSVIKETMRLIAPVPVLGFKTLRAGIVAGFALEAGATVLLSPHLTHRLPEIYARPDFFMPERWASIRPTAYEYLPFSGGPRRCPGYHFALTNLRVALCAIIARYRLALPRGARIDRRYAAITVPRGGVPMRILPQDGKHEAPEAVSGTIFDLFRMESGAPAS
jgi:cytochrome P450